MKALVFNGPRDIRYETYKDPELRTPNSAIIKVKKCSICGSDLHMYHGHTIGSSDYGEDAHKFCTGHEFIGEVVEVGPDAHTLAVGDQVLASAGSGCGHCDRCRSGQGARCRKQTAFGIGMHGLEGGQAEFVCVPNADQTLLKTGGAISDEHALLLTDAMATAYFGISRADVKPGGTVAVVGLGPVGLLGVEIAFTMGAAQVIAIDPVESRRKAAEALGATALAPGKDLGLQVKELTGGARASSVLEASGAPAAIESVMSIIGTGGTVSCIGLPNPAASVSLFHMVNRNITVRGGLCSVTDTWPDLLPLVVSGRIKGDGLFTHTFDLSEGAEAFRLFDQREDGVVKIMIDVSD